MGYSYIHFFNIEYWYCVIISLFGSHCTDTELASAGLPTTTVSGAGAGTTPPGFWEWLFGIHSSGAGEAGGSALQGGILASFFGIIGGIFSLLWGFFSFLAFTLSFLLFFLIAASLVGIFLIRSGDEERYGNLPPASERPHPLRARWQALLENAMSSDPRRWKEGIIGADELLGELFSRLGYAGNTTAAQIRAVPEGAFANLPSAWEAHRIRNFIASPSSHFILTQREAFRVMKLYEQVFREFDFI